MKNLVIITLLTIGIAAQAQWTQIGQDIDGEAAGDRSGHGISLSSDGSIVAIGGTDNDGNGTEAGHVRVYENTGGTWTQVGQDIDGEAAGDNFGNAISLSSDGSIVAIGAWRNDGNGIDSGQVRVYKNIGGTWTQVGQDIDGEAAGDGFGIWVSLSSDGSVVAIGATLNDGNGTDSGHVRVFENNGGTWTQVGQDIDGETADDRSGRSVSLSSDGSIVAIGAHWNDGNGNNSGHVRVFENMGGTWTQIGQDIDGEAVYDQSGISVSLSSDGSVVAIGANLNDDNGSETGHVRVYENTGGTWTQVGQDIDGETVFDQSGVRVSLSSDGSVVAIGARFNDGNGSDSGHVRVYENVGGTWTQVGVDIDGEAALDESSRISLSSDGSILAIGARGNDGNGPDTGHVRVYEFYCSSYGNSTEREWIQTIDIGTYTNNSGDNGGYLYHTNDHISVENGQPYTFTGNPGFSNRSRREFWRVWIDYNSDGDFTDSGEEVFTANGKKGTVSGSITIPEGLTGDTKMRVSMKYNAPPGPCEQFDFGEVEDYKLTFTTPVPLPPIADFEGTPTTVTEGNSVDFTDLSLNNPTSWDWTFEGGTPVNSTNQNPTVTYDTAGTYQVSLTATNTEGSDTNTVAGYITVNPVGGTTYCDSSSQSNGQEWIAQVDIDGFSNPTGASLYSDFTGLTVGLVPGSSSNVDLTPGYSGSSQREFWRIWIDFNNDGDFDDSGEKVFAANNKKNTVSGTISIPASATGLTRMRISMKNGGSPGPCEIFPGGEVEDYTVSFMASAPLGVSQFYNRDIEIFPNPSNGRFQIMFDNDIHPGARLIVYDIKGILLKDVSVNQSYFELDLSGLNDGIYLLHIINGKEYYHSKLVKK